MDKQALIAAAIRWQQDGPSRRVSIHAGESYDRNYFRVWCYDYTLMVGDNVDSVEQLATLDLVAVKRARLVEELERMGK